MHIPRISHSLQHNGLRQSPFYRVPYEVVRYLFQWITDVDLLSIRSTCRTWKILASPLLWEKLFQNICVKGAIYEEKELVAFVREGCCKQAYFKQLHFECISGSPPVYLAKGKKTFLIAHKNGSFISWKNHEKDKRILPLTQRGVVALYKEKDFLVSVLDIGTILLYDLSKKTTKCLFNLRQPPFALNITNNRLVCCYSNGSICSWLAPNHPHYRLMHAELHSRVLDCCFDNNYAVLAMRIIYSHWSLSVRYLADIHFKKEFPLNEKPTCLAIEKECVFFGTASGTVYAWDFGNNKTPAILKQGKAPIVCVLPQKDILMCVDSLGKTISLPLMANFRPIPPHVMAIRLKKETGEVFALCLQGQTLNSTQLNVKYLLLSNPSEKVIVELIDLAAPLNTIPLREYKELPAFIHFEKKLAIVGTEKGMEQWNFHPSSFFQKIF